MTKILPVSTKAFWGVGQIGEGVKNIAFSAYLLFYYNQILGVSATLVSIALGIAVLCDAISDPVAGSVSDRFDSRWGRRHPFMAASALPLAITLYFLFDPPGGMSEMFYFGWVLVFTIAVRTIFTLYYIPHLALGAEMATDYADRNSLFSFGLFFSAVSAFGFSFAMLSTVFAPRPELANGMYNADGYPLMSASAGAIAFVTILVCTWGTRKEIPNLSGPRVATEPLGFGRVYNELKTAFSSPSYRSIFLGLMLGTVVVAIEGVLGTFMNVHFWGLETNQIRWIGIGLIVGLPIGTIIAAYLPRYLDKKWCLVIPAALQAINGNVLIVSRLLGLLPENGHWIILPLLITQATITAIIVPVVFISINSMFADISDELELKTGERQEGIIYSARAFALKGANAIGTMMGGLALDLLSFPKNAIQGRVDPDVIFNLGLVQGPLTTIFSFSGLLLYLGYKLSRTRHAEIVVELELRRNSRTNDESTGDHA